ncbi:MAG: HD domain-containing protein [bacterium]|nr:HD domain-containing protein [bacterium]
MITRALIEKIFEAASMQRWNDQIRPVELVELDKQAHKMIIAYVLGKFEEGQKGFDWIQIIEGGFFEFLQRLILTDLKPPIFHRIKKHPNHYRKLNEWIYLQLKPKITPLGREFCQRFRSHFLEPDENNLNQRILNAAHFYASRWEFNIIERANPGGFEIDEIRQDLDTKLEEYNDLKGISKLYLQTNIRNFVDLCGQLRFQYRWSHVPRTPKTSVLGHMLVVAILAYLFSGEIHACRKRSLNNYFTGLFHDLPEVLTRDIISPVKRSVSGLDKLIKQYESEQMKKVVYRLIPPKWHPEIKMFTEDEFKSVIILDKKIVVKKSEVINRLYNEDRYNPRDGEIIKAIDNLTAYLEAFLSINNGLKNDQLIEARDNISKRYTELEPRIGGIDFSALYADFKQ